MLMKKNPNEKNKSSNLNISDEKVFTAISKRAYDLYCKRGYQHGHDQKDWLEAEKQVKKEMGISK